jgi:hypothetical protein
MSRAPLTPLRIYCFALQCGHAKRERGLFIMMKQLVKFVGVIGLAGSLGACASIIEGTQQDVSFQVSPKNATCHVYQSGALLGTLQGGGGVLNVPKSSDDLQLDCNAPGYQRRTLTMESSPSGWGIAGCFLDFCITDYATGALNKYETDIAVALLPNNRTGAQFGNQAVSARTQQNQLAQTQQNQQARYAQTQQYRQQQYQQQQAQYQQQQQQYQRQQQQVQQQQQYQQQQYQAQLQAQQAQARAQAQQQYRNPQMASAPTPQYQPAVARPGNAYAQTAAMPISTAAPTQWRTSHPGVRAYWGSDTSHDYFEMPNSVPLTPVKRQQQWGLFQYLANDGRQGQVWIALNEVRALR